MQLDLCFLTDKELANGKKDRAENQKDTRAFAEK
jgi:hypothetical protein